MSILSKIVEAKRTSIAAEMMAMPWARLEERLPTQPSAKSFAQAICNTARPQRPALIAEIKKASPSKGLIREEFNPTAHALAYQNGGASCISVLTDQHFKGSVQHFIDVRKATPLPLLRKDFMIDPWQILHSRIIGADCILLIMAILSDQQASELCAVAEAYSLDVLIEVHDQLELDRALALPERCMIGVNNRNLHDFSMDLQTTRLLLKELPIDRIGISESGIHSPGDVEFARNAGAKGILVGESLMRQSDLETATKTLLG